MIDPELAQRLDKLDGRFDRVDARFASLERLVDNVVRSLGSEIGDVKAIAERFSARLDKIAAGTHYVTRLAEWSEKQDAFQKEILERVRAIEANNQELKARVADLEKRNGK